MPETDRRQSLRDWRHFVNSSLGYMLWLQIKSQWTHCTMLITRETFFYSLDKQLLCLMSKARLSPIFTKISQFSAWLARIGYIWTVKWELSFNQEDLELRFYLDVILLTWRKYVCNFPAFFKKNHLSIFCVSFKFYGNDLTVRSGFKLHIYKKYW